MPKLYQKIDGVAQPLSGGAKPVDNLDSTSTILPLSANMGRELDKKLWSGTQAEFELASAADIIPDGAVVNITDDYESNICNTVNECVESQDRNNVAGASALAELSENVDVLSGNLVQTNTNLAQTNTNLAQTNTNFNNFKKTIIANDANDATETGFYHLYGAAANNPVPGAGGSMLVMNVYNDGTYIKQIAFMNTSAFNNGSNFRVFARITDDKGSWSSWTQFSAKGDDDDAIYYKAGDEVTLGTDYDNFMGIVTSSGTSFRVAIPLPKKLNKISSIKCTTLASFQIRQNGNYLFENNAPKGTTVKSVVASKLSNSNLDNYVEITITTNAMPTGTQNNSVVAFNGYIKLTFS